MRLLGLITIDNAKRFLRYLKFYGIKVTLRKIVGKLTFENSIFDSNIATMYVPLIKIEEAQTLTVDNAKISVVIPTKNAGEGFENLLKMVITQKGLSVEIVIVDSGSTDATLEIAKKYKAQIIELSPEKFSHSYSRNLGAENASGNYLFFTVQDALIPSDSFLNELLITLRNNDIVAVSCAEFPRSDADLFYRATSWNHYKFLGVDKGDRILSLPAQENYITLRSNGQLSDIACLIGKDTFMKYKYRYNYAEDLDLGIRLIRDRYKLGFLSSVRIIHSHNRPAFYYLKRGYVDNIFLSNIFPDQPIPGIKFDQIIRDIMSACFALNSLVAELEKTKLPLGNKMLFGIVTKSLESSLIRSYSTYFDEVSGKYLGEEFISFFEKLYHQYCAEGKVSHRGILHDSVLNFMRTVFKYIDNTYEIIDKHVLEDFKFCIYKTYALLCGAHLAYSHIRYHNNSDDTLQKIHDELTKGV